MSSAIFVNMTVSDLKQSMGFFEPLGYHFNPQFTNDEAASLVISDTIYAMLHTPDSIRRFTQKEIVDAHKSTEVLLALQEDSREAVDALTEKALAAGGKIARETEDYGFMYCRSFEDLDGHIWEIFWMDPSQMPSA